MKLGQYAGLKAGLLQHDFASIGIPETETVKFRNGTATRSNAIDVAGRAAERPDVLRLDHNAIRNHVEVVVLPFTRRAGSRWVGRHITTSPPESAEFPRELNVFLRARLSKSMGESANSLFKSGDGLVDSC